MSKGTSTAQPGLQRCLSPVSTSWKSTSVAGRLQTAHLPSPPAGSRQIAATVGKAPGSVEPGFPGPRYIARDATPSNASDRAPAPPTASGLAGSRLVPAGERRHQPSWKRGSPSAPSDGPPAAAHPPRPLCPTRAPVPTQSIAITRSCGEEVAPVSCSLISVGTDGQRKKNRRVRSGRIFPSVLCSASGPPTPITLPPAAPGTHGGLFPSPSGPALRASTETRAREKPKDGEAISSPAQPR